MRKLVLIISISCFSFLSHSQNLEIGGVVGYGKSVFNDHLDFEQLFSPTTYDNCKLGFVVSLKPNVTSLVFNSGILYQRKGNNEFSLNFIKIPIGLDVEPGKTIRFIIGGGFYFSYLFLASGTLDPDIKNSKSDFQFGSYIDLGMKYKIASNWSIYCKFQLDFDLSMLYKERIPSHQQDISYQGMRSYDYTINLGFNYLINRKLKK